MYLSIRKAFSGFRSLSVDASGSAEHDAPPTWRRFSMSKTESSQEKSSHTRASSDSGISSPENFTPNISHILSPLPEVTPNKSAHSNMESLLQALLRENKILRNENTYLKLEAHEREEELARFRSEYHAKRFNAAVMKHILGYTSEGHRPPPSQLFSPPLKLHRPPESTVGEAVSKKGATVGVIQPDAVLVSSKNTPTVSVTKTNDWSEVITCRTTRAIKDTRVPRPPKMHKSTNKLDLNLDRPGICVLGQGGCKSDDQPPETGPAMLASTTAGSIPNSNEGLTPRSISRTPGSFCHSRGRNSTPLTSETLGDEIKDSLASVKRTPIKKLRSLSKEADIDRIRVGSRSVNQSIECSRSSAKEIGKRKAILLEHSPLNSAVSKLVKNSNTFLKRVRSTSQIDVHSRFAFGDCRSNETIGSLHPSAPMLETSTAFSAEDSEALSAEKARLSLERICAGFSSGSFGSLESTSDLSSVDHPLPDVPSLSVGDTTAEAKKLPSVRSRTFGPESQSFSCLFVKTPTPLVSKYCPSKLPSPLRPATNSLKTMPYSTMRTPRKSTSHLRLTKMTAAVSSSPSPRKKTIYKRTSPLRIAKKAKGNVSVRSSPFRA